MVPISGYYLGATPSTPMNAPPFTRPVSQTSQPRNSLPSGTPADIDRAPSPETRARQNESPPPPDDNELPPIPTIKVDSHEDKLDDEELEKAREAPIGSEPRSRSGTMKSDFKFPPSIPPPSIPQIIVGHHDEDEPKQSPPAEAPEQVPEKPVAQQDNSVDDEVGETVEVDLS